MKVVRRLLVLLYLPLALPALSNDSAKVRLFFAPTLALNKFRITIDDGVNEYKIDPKNEQSWCGELFSHFGYIQIDYPNSDTTFITKKAFFKKGEAKIYLMPSAEADEYYYIDEKSSANIISYSRMGGAVLDSFKRTADSIFLDFIKNNRPKLGTDTGILHKAFRLFDSIVIKDFEFIKLYPDLFISFWTFSHQIVYSKLFEPDTLLQFYNMVLRNRYKNFKASEFLISLIKNKKAIKTGGSFPDFSVTDINKNRIELSKLKGKYVLIQFWASWCTPCIAEMPVLRAINDKYKQSDFILISFSVEENFEKFQMAVERNSMNWIQVFGDNRLYDSLGERGVPQVYLLDKNGHTIYNRHSAKDPDLILLKKILSEKLDK